VEDEDKEDSKPKEAILPEGHMLAPIKTKYETSDLRMEERIKYEFPRTKSSGKYTPNKLHRSLVIKFEFIRTENSNINN
jgi:hypothetical protein